MATPAKKPSTFTVGGQTYSLNFNFNALCTVEQEAGMGFVALMRSFGTDMRIEHIAILFRAGLAHEIPDIDRDQAVEMIEAIGPLKAAELIAAAVEASPVFAKRPTKRAA